MSERAPSTSPPAARPRVLFYSHDGGGLGHLRITLGVAGPFAARRPDASILLLTGSLLADAFGLPDNVDTVKLPAVPKRSLYQGLPAPPAKAGAFSNVMYLREAIARATAEAFAPRLVVVDHAPAGLFREFAAALARLRVAAPTPRLVLLMRDITFGVRQTREIWEDEGVYDLLDRVYDRILVYGDQSVFDPVAAYGLSAAAAAKLRFVGYLAPEPPARTPATVRAELGAMERPLAVVTVGGGADGAAVLEAYLNGAAREAPPGLVSFVVTGPLLAAAERERLAALAAPLPGVTLIPFTPDLGSYLQAADVVVTMGGYNALCEAVHAGKRPVVVPRRPGPDEQVLRAQRFADLGLASVVHPDELSPKRLWGAIRDELGRGFSPPPVLPFGGVEAIVDELDRLLDR